MNMEIEQIVSNTLGIPKNLVNDAMAYQSILQWDSMGHVNLMLAIEQAYNISIDEDLVLQLTSVKAIKNYLSHTLSQKVSNNIAEPLQNEKSEQKINRGLSEIYFDNTQITFIDGTKGKLLHSGYQIEDLARYSTFEECAYLLFYKKLPTKSELEKFHFSIKENRKLPDNIIHIINLIKGDHPVNVLRTTISALSSCRNDSFSMNHDQMIHTGITLIAKIPTILITHNALRKKLPIIEPNHDFSQAENFLHMLIGKTITKDEVSILDRDLILHADHGANASAFTGRIAISTQADLYAAVTAAISTFSGALHGGALESVMNMLIEIDKQKNVTEYIKERIRKNLPIFGFGHRVYRAMDPRASQLKEMAIMLSQKKGDTKWLNILDIIVKEMEPYSKHGININVDFYAAIIYHLLGIPHDMFVSIFIMSRIAGWIAQFLEQFSNNILIRPRLNYVGHELRSYINIENR